MNSRMNRRQALGALGTISLGGLLAACGDDDDGTATVRRTDGATATVEPRPATTSTTPALLDDAANCGVTAQATEGPYHFDADAIRRDIREGRDGTRLRLALRLREAGSCDPLPDAVVDVWHADAQGSYSGFDGGGDAVFGASAYGGRGERAQRNDSDAIFEQTLVMTTKQEDGGYVAAMNFDVRRA